MAFALDCKNDKTSSIKIETIDESPFHLKGSFPGPEGTPYQGGNFEIVGTMSPTIHAFDPNLLRLLGYRNTGVIPISASEDEIHHESVPSQRLVSFGSHLPRYPQGCLVPCPHIEIDIDFATEFALLARAE